MIIIIVTCINIIVVVIIIIIIISFRQELSFFTLTIKDLFFLFFLSEGLDTSANSSKTKGQDVGRGAAGGGGR